MLFRSGTAKGKSGLAGADAKAAADALAKQNDDYIKTIKELQSKVADAQDKYNTKMADAQKNFEEDKAKIEADFAEKKLAAEEAYSEAKIKLEAKRDDDLLKAAQDNEKKIADITETGRQKLLDIVKQSVDRLRNAFQQGTSFNVSDLFKGLAEAGTQSADGLIAALKARLTAAKDLAANAAKLQAQGFSQTFIEQVVAAGPEVGNQLSQSILNAKPETIKELQNTYVDLERLTNTGMDGLANTMNQGANLATDELRKAYAQANADTARMLQEQATAYKATQADINTQFNKDMADAMTTRDRAIADAQKAMDKAMADANKALAEAQAAARKQLSEDLSAIQKEFDDKLGAIRNATANTIAQLNALKAAMALAQAQAAQPVPAPTFTPVDESAPKLFTGPIPLGATRTATGYTINNNTTVIAQTNASPSAIAQTATTASKLQSTVTLTSSQIVAARKIGRAHV